MNACTVHSYRVAELRAVSTVQAEYAVLTQYFPLFSSFQHHICLLLCFHLQIEKSTWERPTNKNKTQTQPPKKIIPNTTAKNNKNKPFLPSKNTPKYKPLISDKMFQYWFPSWTRMESWNIFSPSPYGNNSCENFLVRMKHFIVNNFGINFSIELACA